jgi:hypothetical protein
MRFRFKALAHFSEKNIRPGRPLATLEEVLVPVFLLHRYQVEAVGKLIGGQAFSYALRGDGQHPGSAVEPDRQRAAIAALIGTIVPAVLRVPQAAANLIQARPPGFPRTRETFPSTTGGTFDPFGPADSAVALTLDVLLEPARAARMNVLHAENPEQPAFDELLNALMQASWRAPRQAGVEGAIQRRMNIQVLERLMLLAGNRAAGNDVQAQAFDHVNQLDGWLSRQASSDDGDWRAHYAHARWQIERLREDPSSLEQIVPVEPPPGSPIGGMTDVARGPY